MQELDEDDTLDVGVSATDPDGDALTLAASNLPAFAGFVDNGDGTGTLSIAPGFGDTGECLDVVIEVSDGSLTDSESFTITVNELEPEPIPAPVIVSHSDGSSTTDTTPSLDWDAIQEGGISTY